MTVSIISQFKNQFNTDSNEFNFGHFDPSRDNQISHVNP